MHRKMSSNTRLKQADAAADVMADRAAVSELVSTHVDRVDGKAFLVASRLACVCKLVADAKEAFVKEPKQ